MASNDFDELISQARQIGTTLSGVFEEVTGEKLDLEGTIKHYPLVAVGLGIGIGAVAGWWVGSKRATALPPPAPELPGESAPAGTPNRLSDFFKRALDTTSSETGAGTHPLDRLETLFPAGADKVRDVLPDLVSEEAAAMAKTWVDTVLEPRLRQGIDSVANNVSESKIGAFIRDRLAGANDAEEHHLDDPEPPSTV
jgi:hypothetical protein